MQQVLPTLQRLSEDHDSTVQVAAIDGLAQLLPLHGSNPEMAGRLYSHFDELVTSNQPQVHAYICSCIHLFLRCFLPSLLHSLVCIFFHAFVHSFDFKVFCRPADQQTPYRVLAFIHKPLK